MRTLVIFFGMILFGVNTFAQYGYDNDSYDGPDRYFYNEDFDWRWDVRVRISDGIANGSLTRREADRLYDRLERIERKEYAYQEDGYLSAGEQDDIWQDVVFLNRQIGLELSDWDRTYYGYSLPGVAFRGYLPWYFGNTYDFYRFDRRGYGNLSLGYRPRYFYPKNHVYYGNRNFGYNWDRNRNTRYNNGWNNNGRNGSDRNNTWNNGGRNRNNSGNNSWNNQDRNRNNSDNSGRNDSWNNRDRDQNNSRNNTWNNGGSNNNSNNDVNRGEGNRNWGNNGGNRTPSTVPNRGSQRSERPSPSTRSNDNERSRGEIMTPRPAPNTSDTRGSNRGNTPDRGRANDSRRGGREF